MSEVNCIFCKIRDGEIPKEFTYQDNDIMVFPDIKPVKPTHLLIIPKKHIEDLLDLEDRALLSRLLEITQKMIRQFGLTDKGYYLMTNGGGHQIVPHLHTHLIGPMGKAS